MSDRYLIFGAAFNGNGTTADEATSNGGIGAWNQETILTGTAPSFGTLPAGATVQIRSKTGNGANADISRTISANTVFGAGAGVATAAQPIIWILDDGETWPGQNGELRYTSSSGSFTVQLRDYNFFYARNKHKLVIACTATVPPSNWLSLNAANTHGLLIEQLSRQANLGGTNYGNITYDGGYHSDLRLRLNRLYGSGNENRAVLSSEATGVFGTGRTTFDNLEVEVTTAGTFGTLFVAAGTICGTVVQGGRLYGDGAGSGIRFAQLNSAITNLMTLEADGFDFPKVSTVNATQPAIGNYCRMHGLDDGTGSEMHADWGSADTRNYTANYPYLNATLADSASSPCTWRVVPAYASPLNPVTLPIDKVYQQAAATKTITLDLLVSDNFAAGVIDTSTVWMTVSYISNSTGQRVTQSTRALRPGTALTASSAAWSATSWGAVNFGTSGKRKLEITTTDAIKQNTVVTITFYCSAKSAATALDQLMVDPDPQFT